MDSSHVPREGTSNAPSAISIDQEGLGKTKRASNSDSSDGDGRDDHWAHMNQLHSELGRISRHESFNEQQSMNVVEQVTDDDEDSAAENTSGHSLSTTADPSDGTTSALSPGPEDEINLSEHGFDFEEWFTWEASPPNHSPSPASHDFPTDLDIGGPISLLGLFHELDNDNSFEQWLNEPLFNSRDTEPFTIADPLEVSPGAGSERKRAM
ncbi:hypothetical protein CYLTODRAFT_495255 [Cylindrobasidium torrendii FP15055 ss-10]|uniref:Uncharacterized protein n=1 Tax=Cylindrobasidium torrendii FP15055 ss-10 TaxID=1314674 RepID=A0A0D7AT95_9AGAR|nr:hypothetical protein CYLTODRAFT_495255 [Cylindrobasidium torrendii FP15055 ss-10]